MSEQEHIRGKLRAVVFIKDGEQCNVEDTCRLILLENDYTPDPDYSGDDEPYQMQMFNELYKQYVVYNESVYEVYDERDDDIYIASMNSDKTIDFEVSFYNGEQSMEEAIGTALGRMFENDKILRERT